jgi:hypothetical protein
VITYSFPRYLRAKRTVDDRALNRPVWENLQRRLIALQPGPAGQPAPRILEIGGGTGAMFQRMVEWGALASGHYTLLDAAGENIEAARRELTGWALARGYGVCQNEERLTFTTPGGTLSLNLIQADLFDFIRDHQQPPYDVLVAHAFLDLIDIPTSLPLLRRLARPGSLFYLTINFDGLTAFEPVIDAALDDQIVALYHQTMDDRQAGGRPSGSSRSGRHMFSWLPQAGFELLAAGSSDWAVFPQQGRYPDDEAYFLYFILHFFESSLQGQVGLSAAQLGGWLARRREQVERGELVFLAHQFDFLAVMR